MKLLDDLNSIIWSCELKQRDVFIKATDAYKKELQNLYEMWLDEYLADLEGIPEGERREYIVAALLLFSQQMKERQRLGIMRAFNMGLAGEPPSPQALVELSKHITSQEKYVDESLLPYLEDYFIEHLDEEDYKEGLLKRAARIGLYAGAFWATTQLAQLWISQPDRECVWISRDDEGTCKQCHDLHMKKFTVATLPATPGVDVECNGNCRCLLIFEGLVERWPYQGNP